MRAVDPDEYLDMDDQQRELAKSLLQCAGSRHSQTLRWEQCRCRCLKTRWRWTLMLEWSQRWCEEVQRESVRCWRNVLIKPTWKYVTTGEYCDCDAVETLSWCTTVGGTRTEQECEMFRRCHEYEKSSMQTVISTTTSHRAKRDEAQLKVVTHEHVDAMRAPEHYASTLRTRTLQSGISRVMSKCRTRQLESCGALSAFFLAWLERGVRMKKDP